MSKAKLILSSSPLLAVGTFFFVFAVLLFKPSHTHSMTEKEAELQKLFQIR
jgi:hypothetical protein